MGGPSQQVSALPNFQGIVDPAFLQDQQSNLYQQLLAQQSGLGGTGALGGQTFGQQQQPFGQPGDPFQQGSGYDPSMLTSLFGP